MAFGSTRRQRTPRWLYGVVICSCVLLTGYFVEHTLSGRYGLARRGVLFDEATKLRAAVTRLERQREELQHEVGLLGSHPHIDLIEEAALRKLGFVYPEARLLIGAARR